MPSNGLPLSAGTRAFGPALRARREALGLSQLALAAKAGVASTTLSHIERLNWGPTLDVAVRLAAAAGTSVGALLGEVAGRD